MPIIEGSAAHLGCVKVAAWPGGDHVVYLGHVEKIHRAPRKGLAFGEGRYMVTFEQELGGPVPSADDGDLGDDQAGALGQRADARNL